MAIIEKNKTKLITYLSSTDAVYGQFKTYLGDNYRESFNTTVFQTIERDPGVGGANTRTYVSRILDTLKTMPDSQAGEIIAGFITPGRHRDLANEFSIY